jgi:hypothetical protein
MNIILAQLKKDVRCQRRPLILWAICLLLGGVPYAIAAALSHAQGKSLDLLQLSETQKIAAAISYVAIILGCIMAAGFGMFLLLPILVTRAVHEDPLMGTTAFWRTRPIPRRQFLLAKALFIAILLLPLLLAMAYGAKVEGKFWLGMTAWIAAVAAVASITPGASAWFGYGLSFLFGKLVFSGIINALWNHYHGPEAFFSDETLRSLASAGEHLHLNTSDFFHVCYLAGFAAVFIHQYLTLRTKRSVAIFIAVLVAVALLQMLAGPAAGGSGPVIQVQTHSSSF